MRSALVLAIAAAAIPACLDVPDVANPGANGPDGAAPPADGGGADAPRSADGASALDAPSANDSVAPPSDGGVDAGPPPDVFYDGAGAAITNLRARGGEVAWIENGAKAVGCAVGKTCGGARTFTGASIVTVHALTVSSDPKIFVLEEPSASNGYVKVADYDTSGGRNELGNVYMLRGPMDVDDSWIYLYIAGACTQMFGDKCVAEYPRPGNSSSTLVVGYTTQPNGVAVASGEVYWTMTDGVYHHDPGNNQPVLVTAATSAQAIVSDGTQLYWSDPGKAAVRACTASSCTASDLAGSLDQPAGVALDGMGHVYWAERTRVASCAAASCAGGVRVVAGGQTAVTEVAAEGGHVYWVQGSRILRAAAPW